MISRAQRQHLWDCYRALKEQRNNHDHDWQEQVELVLPMASDIMTEKVTGSNRTDRLFDTTATMSAHMLAGHIFGHVTNPALDWFRLKFRDEEVNGQQEVSKWLDAVTKIMLASYASSNFYQAAHTYYMQLAVFGTAAMFVGTRNIIAPGLASEVHLRFRTLAMGSYCIAENGDGLVDTMYRLLRYTPRQAYQLWGEKLSRQVKERLKDPHKAVEYIPFLHVVYPREDRWEGRVDNQSMPFASVILEEETQELVEESGYEEFPFLVSRWETLDNSPWGYGPGHIALPDIRVLNKLKELNLLQLVLWVQPPLKQLREGVIGNVSLEPYALNIVTQADALSTLDLTGRPDLVKIDIEELKNNIRDIFFVNLLQTLPPPDVAKMTAYEVAQRIEQMQRLMGPAFFRLLSEMLDPLADRIFGLLIRAMAIPQMPQAVLDAARMQQGRLDVEYEGPLAKSQRAGEVRAIADMYVMGNQMVLATQDLTIWDNMDHDEAFRRSAEVSGVPMHLLTDIRAMAQMRAARQEALAKQTQAMGMREDAAAMGKVAPAMQVFNDMQKAA